MLWPDVAISSTVLRLFYRRLPHQCAHWFAMTRYGVPRCADFDSSTNYNFTGRVKSAIQTQD